MPSKEIEIAVKLLQKHEGFRGKVYKDTTGHDTIGYGHNLDAHPLESNGKKITEISRDRALLLLVETVHILDATLSNRVAVYRELSPVRKAVLLDMAYNMGISGLFKFHKMFQAITDGNYADAAFEMIQSKWANQVLGRATELAEIMKTGSINGIK